MDGSSWTYGDFDWEAADAATAHFQNIGPMKRMLKLALIASAKRPLRANVIFTGQGGYGKSEFGFAYVEAACHKIPPHVMNMHGESTMGNMAGDLDVPSFIGGNYRYQVERSWMNHYVSIWEEGLDAAASTLLSQKDPITRRIFTNGETFDIKTHLIIINTNHELSTFSGDRSKMAFLERFMLHQDVSWAHASLDERLDGYRNIILNNSSGLIPGPMVQQLARISASEMWSPRRSRQAAEMIADIVLLDGKKRADEATLMEAARNLGFDTSDIIDQMRREELQAKINEFQSAVDGVLGTHKNLIQQMINRKYAWNDTEAIRKLYDDISKYVKLFESYKNQCRNARNEFGAQSDQIMDGLILRIEELEAMLQDAYNAPYVQNIRG